MIQYCGGGGGGGGSGSGDNRDGVGGGGAFLTAGLFSSSQVPNEVAACAAGVAATSATATVAAALAVGVAPSLGVAKSQRRTRFLLQRGFFAQPSKLRGAQGPGEMRPRGQRPTEAEQTYSPVRTSLHADQLL